MEKIEETLESLADNPMIIKDLFEQNAKFQEMFMMYRCGIREVQTKLEVLNDEFKINSKRNPIDSIRSRVKEPMSLYQKMKKRGIPLTVEDIRENIFDVAGIRVVCPFIDDIYAVADMLARQDDIKILQVKDYIKNPKPNGYRSLHYVIEVPIFLSDRTEHVNVEVQIRTIAMNFWAALEHQIHYKKFDDESMPDIVAELTECAQAIYNSDVKMQSIRKKIPH